MKALTVGFTTDESSLCDQVQRYKARIFRDKLKGDGTKGQQWLGSTGDNIRSPDLTLERLSDKCINVVVRNFESYPVHENIPARFGCTVDILLYVYAYRHMREITGKLSLELDAKIAAEFVFDENYWKRRCVEQFMLRNCQISEHGLTWKQLFFETYLQQCLEEFEPDSEGSRLPDLLQAVSSCQDYIFTLTTRQLLGHPDVELICKMLPNLTKLEITYGVKKIGMKYDRMLFGMKISDANCLAKCILDCENLTALALQSNLIDDDLLRMLMTGLIKNSQITHLDLAHNKITNHGIRLLSKLLGASSVLTSLNLADNQIHAEGGRYLGRALRANESLVELNLRLNRLVDEGGRMLLEGFCSTCTITSLNLSGNSLSKESSAALVHILEDGNLPIRSLDLSCNEFIDEDIENMGQAAESNKILVNMDLRMNSTSSDDNIVYEHIRKILHRNELSLQAGL